MNYNGIICATRQSFEQGKQECVRKARKRKQPAKEIRKEKQSGDIYAQTAKAHGTEQR